MITRRALVAAGAGALLAGCGRDEAPQPTEAQVLTGALARELSLLELEAGDRDQVAALEEVIRAAGGTARAEPAQAPPGDRPAAALELLRGAMAAYVDAVGRTPEPARRAAIAGLLTGAAEREARLLLLMGDDPMASAFADGRAA